MLVLSLFLIPALASVQRQYTERDIVANPSHLLNGRVFPNQTGNPSNCLNGTKFFAQNLYHIPNNGSSVDNQTFPQQFQVVSDYFKPGGPIFFYQGAETDAISCVENFALLDMAKTFNGLAVSLEHRYFGISTPFGLNFTHNLDWPTASLSPLTLGNVLLDSVTFVEWIKATYQGAETSKAIVFGGSYAGFLSGMLRIHYPETFFGSIASSGVFSGFYTSPRDPELYAQTNWSVDVAEKIKAAFQWLKNRVASGHFSDLGQALSLCYSPNTTAQSQEVIGYLYSTYYAPAQFDYAAGYGSASSFPLQTLINRTMMVQEHLEVLNVASSLYNEMNDVSCGNWNLAQQRAGGFDLPFLWIQCQYFPYVNGIYSHADTIFGASPPDPDTDNLNDASCKSAFDVKAISANGLRERYHITQPQLERSTRIVFSEGLIDPVTVEGPSPFYVQGGSKDASKMLFIDGGAHGSDLFAPAPGDLQTDLDAIHKETQIIKGWLQT